MTRKNNRTQAFIGPLRQGELRPVVQLGKKNGRNAKRNASLRALRAGGKRSTPMTAAAVAYATEMISKEPRFLSRSARGTRIVHEELVGTVTGTAAFTQSNAFALNPGIAATFPWLSTQAQSWQFYKFHRLRLCYYTRAITTDRGSVLMCADYNASEAAPATETIASSYLGCVEESPWVKTFCMDLDVKSMLEPGDRKFVRLGPLAANQDIKTYDGGNLFVFTVDGSAVAWGKLWLEYDVEFFVPQLSPTGSLNVVSQHITGATPTTASLLGTQTTVSGSTSIATVASNVLTFVLPGKYSINYNFSGTSYTSSATPVVAAGGSFLSSFVGDVAVPGYAVAGTGTATFVMNLVVNATVGTTITFSQVIVGGAIAELLISPIGSTQL
jgi:hypothetical protein